ELFHANEAQMSRYALQESDAKQLFSLFESYEAECRRLIDLELPLPAYDFAVRCSHTFNLLDARGAISVTERAAFIKRVRDNARLCAEGYLRSREALGYPLAGKPRTVGEQPEVLEGSRASEAWSRMRFNKDNDASEEASHGK